MTTLRINTIYPAFMGEVNTYGIGVPCTFVRLAGCNLRCYYATKGVLCDTPEALNYNLGKLMHVSEIVREVTVLGNRIICLTGGEPLRQDVSELLRELSSRGFYVVVETNGSKDITPYRHIRNVSFIVDVKSGSSGESDEMLEVNYPLLGKDDFLKFVIDTEEDFEEFRKWLVAHDYLQCRVAVGLFWGSKVSYQWLINQLRMIPTEVYLNMQAHKMACLYDAHKDNDSFSELFIPKEL